ncbi:MAG: tRNA (adenosine(37)-N6)-threonylcarbamoyltransferase complex transferase subunit TsaD [Candidatus Pacebacteria bacterium]|nr:tRNA (adenosine(37)-N6)-threonylcarbamoyltransferase complex transferase subunit TsaD [Candidatus Paceibacterota bacterium]
MKILSIETSCDETAIAIMDFDKEQKEEIKFNVLSNHILSQINIHREFGGVFPMLAKREHAKNIVRIFEECIKEADLFVKKESEVENDEAKKDINLEKRNEEIFEEMKSKFDFEKVEKIRILLEREPEMFSELAKLFIKIEKPEIDAICVTAGPGLAPALWVGINFAKAISIFWDIKVYPINHMEGHIMSTLVSPVNKENKSSKGEFFIKNFSSPTIALLISGGHTEIIYFDELGKYKKIGKTVDDAVGEAFDKVARSLNLPYPGGPEISKIAEEVRNNGLKIEASEKLPRPMINSKDLNFSFSGLKTAVIYKINKLKEKNIKEEDIKNLISLDFENACTDILLKKIKDAIENTNAKSLLIGGGVIANTYIRKSFSEFVLKENIDLYIPEKFLTGDNAFMIGLAGIIHILNNEKEAHISEIKADSNFSLENI